MLRDLRRRANPYMGITEKVNATALGEEALCAAPTPRKRGPCRPPRIGRQGRLPNFRASPRRELPVYHFPYQNILDADLQSQYLRNRVWRLLRM